MPGRRALVLVIAALLAPFALPSSAPAASKGSVKQLRKQARTICAKAARGKVPQRRCRRAKRRARRVARVAAANRLAAPVLRVSGTTLLWNRVADVNRYVLATKLPGRATTYKVVTGIRVTPPAAPGQKVNYGLRTDVRGSAGAREVSIRHPAPAPSPAPAPATPNPAFQFGVVSGSDVVNEARTTAKLGARLVRVEFAINAPAANLRAAIAAHAANGTRVLPLAGFHGRMPTVAEARNVAAWAREFGPGGTFWANRADGHLAVRAIEFGNETSYGYQYGDQWDEPSYSARAREYALRLKDAHEAIRAANPQVGLLGQIDDANTGSQNWINGVFAAVPDVSSRVVGWTIHPYGPRRNWEARMDRTLAWAAARGAQPRPLWITEWGLATDNGRCLSDNYTWDKCMTYAAAATNLSSTVADMRARYGSRLAAFFLYQGRDLGATGASTSREHYFGALRSDLSAKGPYTTVVRSLLAGS
jgi:hypothetical protein